MTEESEDLCYGKKKILFVDSDIASYSLFSEILAVQEIDIIHAGCGPDAIRLIREDPFIDCIVTEIWVPGVDGFGILAAARELNPSIPVIAQTACVFADMKQKCLEAGFNGYISKPVDLDLFSGLIRSLVLFPGRRN
jgi:CheY-like chemotaxis protein